MSFSSKTKGELARIYTEDPCCQLAELAALVRMSGTLQLAGFNRLNLNLTTENPSISRKVYKLAKNLFGIQPEVLVKRNPRLKKNNHYLSVITHQMGSDTLLKNVGILREEEDSFDITYEIPPEIVASQCCKRAYLRGAFLGGGSVSDPEKTYHLEFVTNSQEHSLALQEIINSFELNGKVIVRKGSYVVYLKEGDQVVDLLNIMGAHGALLDLENVRIMKQMRNDINRIVNCETANLSKTVNASVRQIEKIEMIKSTVGLDKLPDNLREIAEIRLNNKESSLKELGQMMSHPIGKSGVNHRLRKIEEFANRLMAGEDLPER